MLEGFCNRLHTGMMVIELSGSVQYLHLISFSESFVDRFDFRLRDRNFLLDVGDPVSKSADVWYGDHRAKY